MILKTQAGQNIDMSTKNEKKFSMTRWIEIAYLKTAVYTMLGPYMLSLIVLEKALPSHDIVLRVLSRLGILYQIKDDFLDIYGDPNITGKKPSDIEEGKCNWVIANAYAMADRMQKRELEKNHGHVGGRENILNVLNQMEFKTHYYKKVGEYVSMIQKDLDQVKRIDANVSNVLNGILIRINCLGYKTVL